MATRGRPKKTPVIAIRCGNCEQELDEGSFYTSSSVFFRKIPICSNCIESMFNYYTAKYKEEGHDIPEKDAIRRICMTLDIYYSESLYEKSVKNMEKQPNITLMASYMKISRLYQYASKTYDNTIKDESSMFFTEAEDTEKVHKASQNTIRFFGAGLPDEDYAYLQEQYDDWTARHECNTKAQEEIFKRLCFKQLELLKASRSNQETKDLDASFQKLLESAKLQPKQNNSNTLSETQTFGTLIDKWENTDPIPEVDPELADVDKIGLYMDVFFKGHLAKMMGLKNGLSNLYTKYIKKYTVEKPEYSGDEDNEALFDAIFGNQTLDD